MKDKYKGYSKRTKKELEELMKNSLITFDANVLLNLYRYSEKTRNEILKLISQFNERIFLTKQACDEFHEHRYEAIRKTKKVYIEFQKNIDSISTDLKAKYKHPFLSDSLQTKLDELFVKIKKDVDDNIAKYEDMMTKDIIYDNLDKRFEGKILNGFNKEEMVQALKDGAERFNNKIPPGFKDEKKDEKKKYGDYIIWKEIICHAQKEKKSIILITDDKKEDWWWKVDDEITIGPKPELVQEIKNEANVDFHMYTSEKFIEFNSSNIKQIDNVENILEEVKEVNKSKSLKIDEGFIYKGMSKSFPSIEFLANSNLNELYSETMRIRNIEKRMQRIIDSGSNSQEDLDHYLKLSSIRKKLLSKIEKM